MDHSNLQMYFLLKNGIFHCYVSLPEGIDSQIWDTLQETITYPTERVSSEHHSNSKVRRLRSRSFPRGDPPNTKTHQKPTDQNQRTLPSLKKTVRTWKLNGLEYDCFLLGWPIFTWQTLVWNKKDQGIHHRNGGLQFRKLEMHFILLESWWFKIRPVTEINSYDVIPLKLHSHWILKWWNFPPNSWIAR